MADNQPVDNGLLGKFVTESIEQPDGSQRQVVAIGSTSSAISVTLDEPIDVTLDEPIAVTLDEPIEIVGNVAHDAGDSGNPVKIGGKAFNIEPQSSGTRPGQPDTNANDRVNLMTDLGGRIVPTVDSIWYSMSALNLVYDDLPTSANSITYNAWGYRKATVGFTIQSTSTPTTFQIIPQCSFDGSNWFNMENGPLGLWVYEDTAVSTARSRCMTFDIATRYFRVRMEATGTTTTKKFTITNAFLHMRT